MFGRDRDADDWEDHHKHKWEWDHPSASPDVEIPIMDIIGIVLMVAGAVLVCSLLACCCRRRRGQVLSPPPPPPPAPNVPVVTTGAYPQQQYVPYPTPVPYPVAVPYPAPAVGAQPMGPYPTAPAATDYYAPPPSYSQAVGVGVEPIADHTHTSPYNPQFKQ